MKLSIIIVTYKSESVIFDCLESICKYNDLGDMLEVVIVDNSPNDSLASVLESSDLNGLDVRYIHNPENGGFGQGNNIGVENSTGEILLFLNPDTIVIEPVFSFLVLAMNKQDVTAAGFRLVSLDGKDNESVGLFPEFNFIYLPRFILNFLVVNCGLLSSKVYPWGADLCIRRKTFIDAGMFDENIFLCNEEPDLIRRCARRKVVIFNKKIIHLEGHTTEVRETRFSAWLESTNYYLTKHGFSYDVFLKVFLVRNFCKLSFRRMLFKDCKVQSDVHRLLVAEINRRKKDG